MKNLETYLKNLYINYSIKELKEELNFFVIRGYCSNNTNEEEYNLQVKVLNNLLETK